MSNFTSSWVQNQTRQETWEKRAVMSIQDRLLCSCSKFSAVFRVQRKKTVWTKLWMGMLNAQNETTEE